MFDLTLAISIISFSQLSMQRMSQQTEPQPDCGILAAKFLRKKADLSRAGFVIPARGMVCVLF